MLFSDGVMRLTVTRTDSVALSDDFVFTAVIQLLDSKGNVLAQSAETDLRSGGTVDISLASRRIVPSMTIRLTGSYGKGQLGKAHSYSLSPALVDPRVSKVTGLTLSAEDFGSAGRLDLGALSIPMSSLGSYLKTATVQEGGIRLYGLLPDGWSGVLCTAPITVADSGSLKVQFSDLAASGGKNYLLNKYADLAGQTIRAEQNVALSGSLSLALSNATLVLSDSGTQTVTLVGAVTVKTVSRAEIDMDELLGDRLAPVTKSKEMGDSVSKYVKQAVFNKIGAAATISTDLPVEELNFGATITSEMFAITQENAISDEVMITSGGSGTLDLITQEDWTCTVEPYEGMEADFTMQLSLTGSGGSSTVAFVNLVFGKEYSLDLSLELAYDWESVTLNLQATEDNNLAFSGTKETGLDLQNMLESYIKGEQKDLLDNVELDDKLTAYLSISRPVFTASADITADPLALFPDFTGSVQAYTYSRGEAGAEPVRNEEPIELVPAGTELQLAYSQGDYAALADSRLCITKKLFLEPEANSGKPTYSAKIEGLLDILNSRPAGLDFEYAIGIGSSTAGEIKLTKAQVQSLISGGYAGSIDVSLDIVFPLGFKILGTADGKEKDGIVIDDLLDLAGQTLEEGEDLLKRDGPDSDVAEKFDKYGSIVSRFALSYVLDNNTGLSISAKAVLVKDEAGKATLVKDVFVDGKAHSFYLSNEEVKQVLACYPFQPKISMTVDPGVVTVPRNAQFSAEAKVSLTFDGTVTVYGDDD